MPFTFMVMLSQVVRLRYISTLYLVVPPFFLLVIPSFITSLFFFSLPTFYCNNKISLICLITISLKIKYSTFNHNFGNRQAH